jgi:hypothetical protein
MKLSEILRALVTTIEQHETENDATAQPAAVMVEPEDSGEVVGQSGEAEQPDGIMIPPLQLKIELLKRAVDVDNVYDHTAESDAYDAEQEIPHTPIKEDEIMALRRAAGLNPAVIQELANDEPLDD